MAKDRSLSTAIHILTALAFCHPELVTSEKLADSLQTNPGLIRRMILKLAQAGLVESIKGKNGGNRLAKPASRISLGEVYKAINDHPLFGSFDKKPFASCKVSCQIGDVLAGVYQDFETKLTKEMRKVKISKILEQIR